jgi:hypothetical protein
VILRWRLNGSTGRLYPDLDLKLLQRFKPFSEAFPIFAEVKNVLLYDLEPALD